MRKEVPVVQVRRVGSGKLDPVIKDRPEMTVTRDPFCAYLIERGLPTGRSGRGSKICAQHYSIQSLPQTGIHVLALSLPRDCDSRTDQGLASQSQPRSRSGFAEPRRGHVVSCS